MLEIEHISVRFSAGHHVQAVEDVSLTLPEGSRVAIVGETGSGKSVLLLAILQLLPPSALVSGSARLDGEDLLQMNRKQLDRIRGGVISYVPQGGGGSMNPLLTVGFQVGEPLMEHRGLSRREAAAASIPLLRRFRLGREEELARAYPHTFSGGMRQRAMVAMGISAGAKILFADEPTKGLDAKRVALVVDTLRQLEQETLLCVTHDLKFAAAVCSQVCVMYAGQQVELGGAEEVLRSPLHPYTQAMVAAMPENGMRCNAGFASGRDAEGGGAGSCRFAARCPFAQDRCREMPPMFPVGERKVRCWTYAP